MTKVDALKQLYTAVGGTDPVPAGSTVADVIVMIAEAVAASNNTGGGSDAVT